MESLGNLQPSGVFELSLFLNNVVFLGFLLTMIGIPLVLILIFALHRTKLDVLGGIFSAVFSGLVPSFLWLSWTKNWGIWLTFKYGPLPYYELWQLIGFGITLVVFIALVTWKYADHFLWIPAIAVFSSAGFAVAFCAADSYQIDPQGGVGILISFLGGAIVAFFICLLVWLVTSMIGRKKVAHQE